MNFTRDHRKISSRRYSWNDINRSSSPSSGDPATGIVPSASYIERSTTVATGSYRFRILEHTMTGMTCRQNQPRNVFRYIKYRSVIIRAVIQGRDYKVNTCCHLSASRHHDFSPFPFSSWVFGVGRSLMNVVASLRALCRFFFVPTASLPVKSRFFDRVPSYYLLHLFVFNFLVNTNSLVLSFVLSDIDLNVHFRFWRTE